MNKTFTIIKSALLLLSTHASAGVEGSMDCKVKSNSLIYISEGKPLEYEGRQNEFQVGDRLEITYGYGQYENNRPGLYFYVKDELRNNTHFKLLIGDSEPKPYMSTSDNSYIVEAGQAYKREFYLNEDYLSIKSNDVLGLGDRLDATFDLYRYYKNEWQAIISDRKGGNSVHVYTLDCRHTNDELDDLKTAFKSHFKARQKAKDLKTEEVKAERYTCEAAIEGWADEISVNKALLDLHRWQLNQLDEQLDAANKRIAELEAAQE